MAKTLIGAELIESHKPKNYKYRFIIHDDSLYKELQDDGYDLDNLDTIHDDELIQAALHAKYKYYDRTIIGKAKEPTRIENGMIVAKKMVTKSDKKLNQIGTSFFTFRDIRYFALRMYYERFDILELFIVT